MHFLHMLSWVLFFFFYHYHAPQLLWNRSDVARLERKAPPAELASIRVRFERSQDERREAARRFALRRQEADAASYVAANRDLEQARRQAITLLDRVDPPAPPPQVVAWLFRILGIKPSGYNDTNYIFP